MGWLTAENKKTATLDKNKLRRWRSKQQDKVSKDDEASISSEPPTGLYFDGKKDATLTRQQKGKKFYTKNINRGTLCNVARAWECISWPCRHEIPYSGHGISIGLTTFRFMKSKGWHVSLMVVGANGCNVNVGHNEGAIVYLEKLLG